MNTHAERKRETTASRAGAGGFAFVRRAIAGCDKAALVGLIRGSARRRTEGGIQRPVTSPSPPPPPLPSPTIAGFFDGAGGLGAVVDGGTSGGETGGDVVPEYATAGDSGVDVHHVHIAGDRLSGKLDDIAGEGRMLLVRAGQMDGAKRGIDDAIAGNLDVGERVVPGVEPDRATFLPGVIPPPRTRRLSRKTLRETG